MKLRTLTILSVLAVILLAVSFAVLGEDGNVTRVAVLSTTDMHGKCWHTDLLTDAPVTNSMLSVSTAVRGIRETYGDGNVILIDNGDLFQGTPASETQLLAAAAGKSSDPPAMAVCLKEIGYDAFVLGNHEFNYDWELMSSVYRYLGENGVPVLAANAVLDGTDGLHQAGENAFTPYVIRTIEVNGHAHQIGILGLENCDITRWDLPSHYPGIVFAHPGNDEWSMAAEAAPFLAALREAGCEFIIVSYHGGIGNADEPLAFGVNTENQGLRMLRESEGIDLLILGHDHSGSYSNTRCPDKNSREVLVVNGGGQQLTQTVIHFREDASGALAWEIGDSRNLDLGDFDPDPELQQKMELYAALASAEVSRSLGTAGGEWDQSADYYIRQTDTVDLIIAASMMTASARLRERYDSPAAAGVEGLDHLDVDIAMTSVVTGSGYVIRPGDLSMRDIYRLYRYANSLLVIPMRGSDIRAVMEENAANRLTARVLNGETYFFNINDDFTHIVFGGINFACDLAAPEGSRIRIDGFSNGRAFEEDRVYLAAVNNYILGNEHCGLRKFSAADALWAQEDGESIQDLIGEYIREQCGTDGVLTTAPFTWRWSLGYGADPAALSPDEETAAARFVSAPEDGHTYVIMEEPGRMTMSGRAAEGGLDAVPCSASGNILAAPLDPEAQRFTVRFREDGSMALVNEDGLFLTGAAGGGLSLQPEEAENGMSRWTLREAYGGWNILCAGTDMPGSTPKALEFYSGHITTYAVSSSGIYVFNFYEIPGR